MSTTAWRIIQLIRSLPRQEQRAVRDFLTQAGAVGQVESNGPSATVWESEEGLPDDDPFFKIMEEVERERQAHLPRPAPDFE